MGMAAFFAAVSPTELARLQADPSLVEEFLFPDDGDSEPDNSMDVDKAWHAIHFMLTGTADAGAEPWSLAVLGGEPIGDDLGDGPARFLTPAQVRQVAEALSALPIDEFAARYAPAAMEAAQIYPDGIWMRDGDDALDYVLENYAPLVQFYVDAAVRGDGAILTVG
ncbi:YfbM family protein [Ideonella sp.]|uniref:YfbM family protein n=1 Tax=Ideonella sp. TaxID=1929293 RepID=UPI002D7FB945|nr:YfbM family protein [Ideonella sp.]